MRRSGPGLDGDNDCSGPDAGAAVMDRQERLLLTAHGLTKQFRATVALHSFDFSIAAGEIHALVGENGAGKSTFIKILGGVVTPDTGEIMLHGQAKVAPRPIAFIHQDLGLAPGLSVVENMFIGAEYPRRARLINWRRARAETEMALGALGVALDPKAMVDDLSAAEKAEIAIARALRQEAPIVVLDEPTAMLPGADVDRLFGRLRELAERGVAVIYISHRLREVRQIARRVTVLRDGQLVFTGEMSGLTEARMLDLIAGRAANEVSAEGPRQLAMGPTLLKIGDLRSPGLGPISLSVQRGEVVGCVGLRGAGQEVLARALVGLAPSSGVALLDEKPFRPRSPRDALRRGVAFITGRRDAAIVRGLTVAENLLLNPDFSSVPRWLRSRRIDRSTAARLMESFDVRPRGSEHPVETLSGGNAQKVVVARMLDWGPMLVIMDEPTAGVDMPTKTDLLSRLRAQAAGTGQSFVLISSDYDEVARACDRVYVFNRGKIVSSFDERPFDNDAIALRCSQEIQ